MEGEDWSNNSPDGSFVATELDNSLARLLVPGKTRPRCYIGHISTKNVVAGHDDIQPRAVYKRTLRTTIENKES